MKKAIHYFFIGCCLLLFTSCQLDGPFYQKQAGIPSAQWYYEYLPKFEVDIEDTTSNYQVYLLLRHDDAYPFSNIWMKLSVMDPQDTVYKQIYKLNKTIADTEGKWLAKGFNGIYEHKIPLYKSESPKFKKSGTYTLQLEQVMRKNPLPAVLNIGIAVEKIKTTK